MQNSWHFSLNSCSALTLNKSNIGDYVDRIELENKDTTDTVKPA